MANPTAAAAKTISKDDATSVSKLGSLLVQLSEIDDQLKTLRARRAVLLDALDDAKDAVARVSDALAAGVADVDTGP